MNQADDWKLCFCSADAQVAWTMHGDCAAFTRCSVTLKAGGREKISAGFLRMATDPEGLEGP